MALSGDIRARIGGDNSDLRSVLSDSEQAVDKSFKRLGKVGIQLGGFAAITRAFSAIVQHARELENPMDANLRRAQQFATGLDEARTTMLDLGAKALGVVNSLGEWWGRQIAILQNGREQVELAERIEAQTAETLAKLAEQKKVTTEINAAKKELEAATRAHAESEAKAAGASAVLALREREYFDLVVKVSNLKAGSPERIRAEAEQQRALTKLKEAERDAAEAAKRAEESKAKNLKQQVPDREALAKSAEREAAAAAKASKSAQQTYEAALKNLELQQQLDELEGKQRLATEATLIVNGKAYGPSRDPRAIEQASSEALGEMIRRTREEILAIEASKGRGPTALAGAATNFLIEGSVIDRLRTDIQRAEYQLQQRQSLTFNRTHFGDVEARRRFDGDPLAYDDFVRSQSAANEQVALLRGIDQKLTRGLRVFPVD